MSTANLLIELFVEELPPKALRKLGEAFSSAIFLGLQNRDFLEANSTKITYASPRRLAVRVTDVRAVSIPRPRPPSKLMPASVGLDINNKPTPQLIKRLTEKLGYDLAALDFVMQERVFALEDGGKTVLMHREDLAAGGSLQIGLEGALREAIESLPIPKVMTYQLADGWSDVKFVRPAHSLIALHGAKVVRIKALGLEAGNTTQGHRFEAAVDPIRLSDADSYAAVMERDGAVIASFEARRAEIVRQVAAVAAKVGGGARVIEDAELLDEVTGLVERPNVLVCQFDTEFLEVPQECLVLTMKANQKYFPLVDANGKLTNRFLVVSNIRPDDPTAVIQGNERVVRPRLADAKFFFDQDRKKSLVSRVSQLAKVVYHNKLGTQGERTERVRAIARLIAHDLGDSILVDQADLAAKLAKADLVTAMVGEFPELQGTMGRYYALNDKLPAEVADAIEDHYKPRFAGDTLPRGQVGVVAALADKLETLVGMFAISIVPSGDRDPFALRRHTLGIVRILVERDLHLGIQQLLTMTFQVLDDEVVQRAAWDSQQAIEYATKLKNANGAPFGHGTSFSKRVLDADTVPKVLDFIYDRLAGMLREQGYSAQEVDAVVAPGPQRLGDIPKRLAAVRAFAALPEAPALAAANKRIANILKKADKADAHVSEILLREPAEQALHAAMKDIAPRAATQFAAGDYTASLQTLAALRAPVDAFFDGVMVNAEQADLRLNRLGLLATLHQAMNRVADLSRLAA